MDSKTEIYPAHLCTKTTLVLKPFHHPGLITVKIWTVGFSILPSMDTCITLVPRPLPDFILQLWRKLGGEWEWPGNKATHAQHPYTNTKLHTRTLPPTHTHYTGTSNWSGDYFVYTGGLSLTVTQPEQPSASTVQQELLQVFERDWNSPYAVNISSLPPY